ncbi:hypothetical protein [Pseudomonas protegens]|uniref:hypothetical protein n=1 Tax=Pseudomonas protegens TaxID=380021 RepID=UPI00275EFE88|nr:hypothetical protein [Pseudomonas protegens]MDP9528524.1 hypothetical protein [Pseudomonas protegens]
MLLNKEELSRDYPLKSLPVSGELLPVLLAKTEEQVSRIDLVSGVLVVLVGDAAPLWKRLFNRVVKAISPFALVVSFLRREAHMSGLPGLLVWKQKATTEAPDTQCSTATPNRRDKKAGFAARLSA